MYGVSDSDQIVKYLTPSKGHIPKLMHAYTSVNLRYDPAFTDCAPLTFM